ncbi:MAG TPA: HAMP domain-containing sensor histidine kinase [Candidatus Wallbacteria bacterium]|nr:HAMP domain-containing sensor histidine kinase [Candidatus Wallbacteria bacterium]
MADFSKCCIKNFFMAAVLQNAIPFQSAAAASEETLNRSFETPAFIIIFTLLLTSLALVILQNRRLSKSISRLNIEIRDYKKNETDRKSQQEYRMIITEAIQMVYKSDDPATYFSTVFERVSRRTGLKSIHIFEDSSENTAKTTYEWIDDTGKKIPAEFSYEKVSSWKKHLNEEVMINYPVDEFLPGDIKDYISSIGASSLFTLPLFINNEYNGFIVFIGNATDILWEEYIIMLFFPIAGILSTAIEKKKNTEELKTLNATKDKFFSILAHDLKSPLAAFIMFIDTILCVDMDRESREATVLSVRTSLSKTLELVESILKWARMQKGDITTAIEKFDIKDVIASNANIYSRAAANKNITLTINAAETYVTADREMILTVVRNLINNAIKFTPEGGRIEVSTLKKGSFAEVSVSNTGAGISPQIMEKLFKLGEKISSVGTAGERGSGFGLILCHDFISKNGGKIRAESEPGKKSTFIFTLPAA